MPLNKPIILVGLMGSGKSTLGKLMSKKLGLKFYDSDSQIVNKENMAINDIFANKGESYFRQIEKDVISELLSISEPSVIAVGGGAFVQTNVREEIKDKAISIWLNASVELLFLRLKDDKDRPLLQINGGNDKKQILQDLADKRNKYYSLADIKIDIDNIPISKLNDKVIEELNNYTENN